jgi:hypothetical protein
VQHSILLNQIIEDLQFVITCKSTKWEVQIIIDNGAMWDMSVAHRRYNTNSDSGAQQILIHKELIFELKLYANWIDGVTVTAA